jgi:aspartate/methionine/tyrosine aminotransferase
MQAAMGQAADAHDFQPFEYMAWTKQVVPGAPFPMHVSGLAAPGLDLATSAPTWCEWAGPAGPVRAAFVERLTRYLGAPGLAVCLTGGAGEAIFVAMAPFVERGAAVIVEDPAYRAMERVAQFLGGVPVRIERTASEGWRFDPERLDALLGETGARLVAITDPHNPTGVSIDPVTRAAVIAVAERHGALLVVDEIFAPFRGPDRPSAWAVQSERVLSLGSLTKGWGLGSLRTGWVIGPSALIARCTQVFDLLATNPPTVTLALAVRAMNAADRLDARACDAAAAARRAFAATDWGAAAMVLPHDGIIGFLRLPPGWTSEAAAASLRRLDGVQVVPGRFFGRDDHLRIGVAGGFDAPEGCRRIGARLARDPQDEG